MRLLLALVLWLAGVPVSGEAQLLQLGPTCPAGISALCRSISSGGASNTAWNPSDKTASTTLSTTAVNNDTALFTSASNIDGVRGTASYGTQKIYFEFNIILNQSSTFEQVGVCNGSFTLSSTLCTQGNFGIEMTENMGFQWNNGTVLTNFGGSATFNTTTIVAIAVDNTGASPLVFGNFSNNSGSTWASWDNTTDCPGTGAAGGCTGVSGGFSLSPSGPSGPFFAYAGTFQGSSTSKVQLVCSGSGYTSRLPSGYSTC